MARLPRDEVAVRGRTARLLPVRPVPRPRPLRRRSRRPGRQPAAADRDPDDLVAARIHPRRAGIHRFAADLGDLRGRDSRRRRGRDRRTEPPGARLPARRTGRAAQCDRAQLEPLQRGARSRAGARWRPDRGRRRRLVLHVQCCLVHGRADHAPADARLRALPDRARQGAATDALGDPGWSLIRLGHADDACDHHLHGGDELRWIQLPCARPIPRGGCLQRECPRLRSALRELSASGRPSGH